MVTKKTVKGTYDQTVLKALVKHLQNMPKPLKNSVEIKIRNIKIRNIADSGRTSTRIKLGIKRIASLLKRRRNFSRME